MLNVLAQASTDAPAGGLAAFMLVFWIISLVSFILFVLDIIHLVQHDDMKNRVLWILVVILVPFGTFVYFFGPRREHNKLHSSGGTATSPESQSPYTPPVVPTTTEPTPSVPPVTGQPSEPTPPTPPTNPTQ